MIPETKQPQVFPRLTVANLADRCFPNAKGASNIGERCAAFAHGVDRANTVIVKFGHSVLRAKARRLFPQHVDSMALILRTGNKLQVIGGCVGFVAVLMVVLHPRWAFPEKSLCHQDMNIHVLRGDASTQSLVVECDPRIDPATTACVWRNDSVLEFSDSPHRTGFVAEIPGDGAPRFILHAPMINQFHLLMSGQA